MRVAYRTRQFLAALFAAPAETDLEAAGAILTPQQLALFGQMQTSEQAHSLYVMEKIRSLGLASPEVALQGKGDDLLVAALLHDVGKIIYPLRIWERVLIVLGKAFFPRKVQEWGRGPAAPGWRKAFVIAEQHPAWGADLAQKAGVSPLAAELIRRHQNRPPPKIVSIEDRYLQILQKFDGDS